ncbi:MAG: iron-sulfur cluster repair di-iron protein [Acidobacteria bacterium]|nr:MAG: iron-sulfur cluster repair di-iron protein [Acidobacteriota bacterium]
MEIDARKTVKEIVLATPASARIFEQMGIDYCCGGDKRLDEACQAAGLQVGDVTRNLEAADSSAIPEEGIPDWMKQPLVNLMNHIVKEHHTFCRQEVVRIEDLLEKVAQVHGDIHSELRRIKALFAELRKELLMHLIKEEQTLFPYITRMEEAAIRGISFPRPPFGTVQNPVQMMVLEHDSAGAALHEIRNLTSNYRLPPDACNSYHSLFEALRAFESDMHQHVHLENNVLFPRAVAMENATISGRREAGA